MDRHPTVKPAKIRGADMQKPKFFIPVLQWLSPRGRISRLQYFVYGLIWAAIFFSIFVGLIMGDELKMDEEGHVATLIDFWINALLQLALIYVFFCLACKRLHDLSWPAWLALLIIIDIPVDLAADLARLYMTLPESAEMTVKIIDGLVKIASLGIGLNLTFRPGDRGINKHGPDPLRPPPIPIDVF
jgi:uncharacterized membrane protein YhaH (DUF805 family)